MTWWAVKCELTNKKDVPNKRKAIATAPFVLNVDPGRVLNESTSGAEQNQMRSRLKKIARWSVPRLCE